MRWLCVCVMALAVSGLVPAAAQAAPTHAVGNGCEEHQAFVEGDTAAVDARLPDAYTPVHTSSGQPVVFARGLRCEAQTLDGRTASVTNASIGVVIESPDGEGCGSALGGPRGDALPVCNWYVLRWWSSDRRTAEWLRDGTPGFPAAHTSALRYEPGEPGSADGGTPFHFEGPGFTIDDVYRERPGELSVRGGYWADTQQGTVKLALSSDDLSGGDANGTVRAEAGSELAALMGAGERPYSSEFSGFAMVRAQHASYRKQVLGPAEGAHSFSGSCSVKGDVHFSPPANNTIRPLTASFTGEGICTGIVDGREVTDAPVHFEQTAKALGSCPRARTIEPTASSMEFAGGPRLDLTGDFSFVGTDGDIELYGTRSGYARGRGSFLNDRSNPTTLADCGGDGVEDAPLDLSFTTRSTLVSAPAGERPGPFERRLRLSVSPRVIDAGERRAFSFRVTRQDGRPVRGALVRFDGRRVRTRRDGRARLVTFVHSGGRHVARAGKAGYVGARAVVRARRR